MMPVSQSQCPPTVESELCLRTFKNLSYGLLTRYKSKGQRLFVCILFSCVSESTGLISFVCLPPANVTHFDLIIARERPGGSSWPFVRLLKSRLRRRDTRADVKQYRQRRQKKSTCLVLQRSPVFHFKRSNDNDTTACFQAPSCPRSSEQLLGSQDLKYFNLPVVCCLVFILCPTV